MNNSEIIKEIADNITHTLVSQGVVVQRYDAYSSNSVYLKFDLGCSCSLRISDHKGINNFCYRFNLDINRVINTKSRTLQQKNQRITSYYNSSECNQLILDILSFRYKRILNVGSYDNYYQDMKNNYLKNKCKRGFWSNCVYYGTAYSRIKKG